MPINQGNIALMQQIKYNLFKTQDPETGRFNVIFEVEGKILYAHHNMLNLVSDTFDAMLSDRWMKNKEIPIKIATYSYDNFCQFLIFLYSGECELSDSNIFAMVDIAEFYGVHLFKDYCDQYLADMEVTAENIFPFIELAQKYSLIQLQTTIHEYITVNFQSFVGSDGFLGTEKGVIEGIIISVKDNVKPDNLFQAVFKWAEKQAMIKKVADPILNLNDAIKTEISAFLAHINFRDMDLEFFCEFVVSRGFIMAHEDISKILCDRFVPKVKVTNSLGQTLHGKLKCDNAFIEAIKALKFSSSINGNEKMNWWNIKCKQLPSNPNPFERKVDVDWYLIYYPAAGLIGYAHFSLYFPTKYVLAEMYTESPDFKATVGSKIEIDAMAVNTRYLDLQRMKFDLYKSQDPEIGLFDVIFEVEGKTLYSHKTMLNLVSTTFASMLSDRWTKKEDPIKIANYSYDNFYQFLIFLYSGECQLTDENIFAMVDIAEFYGVALFKTFCDEYLAAIEITAENIFNLVKLTEKYSMNQLKSSTDTYIIKNFDTFAGSNGFLEAKKPFVEKIIASAKDKVKPEDLFRAIYQWAEKQSMHKLASDSNGNLTDQIKDKISNFLPSIHFDKMEHKFLIEFVVPRGFIFSCYNEISKILSDCILQPKVKVTNALGQTLHGKLKCDNAFIEAIKTLKFSRTINGSNKVNWWNTKCNTPATPSPLKKRDGIEWYLVYYVYGQYSYIVYTHRSTKYADEYIIAELTTESSDFKATT